MLPPPAPPIYRQTAHTFHLIASLCTCGAWAIIWPFVWAANTLGNSVKRRAYERQMRAFYAGQAGGHA